MNTTTKTTVSSYDEALDAIDGRTVTLDGVHGTIVVDRSASLNLRVVHEPSARGRRSAAYQTVRAQLRDDWSTDLTWSERLVEIMTQLGIEFAVKVNMYPSVVVC